MNNIKITVEYEAPKKDKFNELLAQYEQVKQTATETVSYYKPLAEAGERKKIELILEQLETIKEYMLKIYEIKKQSFSICANGKDESYFPKKFKICYNGKFTIVWDELDFNLIEYEKDPSSFNGTHMEKYNILGNWDKWEMYQNLEKQCANLLMIEIERYQKRAKQEKKRFENINN